MASSPFCQFLRHLKEIQPALTAKKVPTLHAFSLLAEEFKVQEPESTLVDLAKQAEAVSSPKKAPSRNLGNGITLPNKDQASPMERALTFAILWHQDIIWHSHSLLHTLTCTIGIGISSIAVK